MWSDRDRDRDRDNERERQRRREEEHGRGLTSDGLRRETGLWMVFFLGAAAVRSSSPLAIKGFLILAPILLGFAMNPLAHSELVISVWNVAMCTYI